MEVQLREFEELVLLTVAAQHDKAYGVSVFEHLTLETGKKINISAIHVVLGRLEKKGLVSSRYGGITDERGGRRKKFYTITKIGKLAIDNQKELRNRIYSQIPEISFP